MPPYLPIWKLSVFCLPAAFLAVEIGPKRRIPEQGSLEWSDERKPGIAPQFRLCSESKRKRPAREGTEA